MSSDLDVKSVVGGCAASVSLSPPPHTGGRRREEQLWSLMRARLAADPTQKSKLYNIIPRSTPRELNREIA